MGSISEEQQRELARDIEQALMKGWTTERLMDEFFNGRKCLLARKALELRGYKFTKSPEDFRIYIEGIKST
jgi:hypothetical protein